MLRMATWIASYRYKAIHENTAIGNRIKTISVARSSMVCTARLISGISVSSVIRLES